MSDWLLDPDVAYLNHGAFGALPCVVGEAAAELRLMMERNPAELMMRRLPGMLNTVRARLAQFLQADEAGCVFVANATAGTSTILASLAPSFEPGDEVVLSDHRYHSVAVQADVMAGKYGITPVVAHVPMDIASEDDVVTAITERITSRTKLLIVDSIASPSGFVFPVEQLVTAAHEQGVPVLVDAAHAPGQIANDLTAIDADFWVGNLHKWICSPRAAAMLSVGAKWRDIVRPHVPSHSYADGLQPAFDWTGTFDPVNVLAVPAAMDFWERLGWEDVRRRQSSLVDDGARRVATALGTSVPVADNFRAAMRVVELPSALTYDKARDVESALSAKHQIEVSIMAIHDKSWVRVCGQLYNSATDYDRLASALPELV